MSVEQAPKNRTRLTGLHNRAAGRKPYYMTGFWEFGWRQNELTNAEAELCLSWFT